MYSSTYILCSSFLLWASTTSLLLRQFQWSKASGQIAFKCHYGSAPLYLTDELCGVVDIEVVGHTRPSTIGDRAFPLAGACGTVYLSTSLLHLHCLSSSHASRLISSPFPIPVPVQCLHSDTSYPSPSTVPAQWHVCFGQLNRSALMLLTYITVAVFAGYHTSLRFQSPCSYSAPAADAQSALHDSTVCWLTWSQLIIIDDSLCC